MSQTIRRRFVSPAALAAAAGTALFASAAQAQVRTWVGGSGLWSAPANWGGDVPDTFAETADITPAGVYVVTMSNSNNLLAINLANPSAEVAVNGGMQMGISGGVANQGLITLNTTGANAGTYFRAYGGLTLSGGGVFRLNANALNLDTAQMLDNGGGQVTTNGAGHTIAGSGRIYSIFVNDGTVDADVAGRTLDLNGSTKTNNGVLRSTGGLLSLSSLTLNQGAGGQVIANGGDVNFSGAGVNGGTIIAMGGGVARVTSSSTFNAVSTAGPVIVNAGQQLALVTGLSNAGTVTVNHNASNVGTSIRALSSILLTGGGSIALNATAGNLDTAQMTDNGGGQVTTNDAGHTIRGTGRIYNAFTNDGLVQADVSGRTLDLNGSTKTNNSVVRATGGGVLSLSSCTLLQGGGGQLLADDSGVTIASSVVDRGLVAASGPNGLVQILATSQFNQVTVQGAMTLVQGQQLGLHTSLTNNGLITVNPVGANNGTTVRALTNVALDGSGTIVLNAASINPDTAILVDNGGGQITTNAATHTIRGAGRIYSNFVNNGVVRADVAGRLLELNGSTKTNNNLLLATNGATLGITSVALNQHASSGVLRADAGTITICSSSISNGLIDLVNGGSGTITCSSSFGANTINGPLFVNAGQQMGLNSSIINNGVITVNTTAGNAGTNLRAFNSVSLDGTGTVVLNAHSSNLDTAIVIDNGGGQVTTNTATHTIRGQGRIYSNFVNDGAVRADVPTRTLQFNGSTKANNALLLATNDGIMDFVSVTLNQSAAGVVRADGGLATFCSSGVTGGLIESINAGMIRLRCSSTFNDVALAGEMEVDPGQQLGLLNTITNNAHVVVNSAAANVGTPCRIFTHVTLDGSGSLILNAFSGNLDTAYLIDNGGGQVLTNGPSHTIGGTGRLYSNHVNQGTLSPGDGFASPGVLDLRGSMTLAPSSVIRIEITGPGIAQIDRITGSAPLTLRGTLQAYAAGYTPPRGETFDVILAGARTGTFDALDVQGFEVVYLPNGVRLVATCQPDVNQDGVADQDDVLYLINVIGGGENPTGIDPDMDGNGIADQDDVSLLINAIAGGGC